MATKVVMAQLSPTMEEGKLLEWKVAEGDTIEASDLLAEIETDKANMDIEALGGGVVLKILVQAGETVPVGALIGIIGEEGEDISALLAEAEAAASGTPVEAPPAQDASAVEEVVGPRQITRENNQRFVTVQSNVLGRDIGSFVEEAQGVVERAVNLPPGYIVTWGGQFRLQQEANRRLAVVVPVMLLAVLLLLYASLQAWKNAFLIVLKIPLVLLIKAIVLHRICGSRDIIFTELAR